MHTYRTCSEIGASDQQSRVPSLTFSSTSEHDTITLGEQLAALLRPGDIVSLDAPLGAGKTRLVRGVARALNCDESLVASPTYVIVHEYPSRSPLNPPLVHVDAYRLSGPDDLDSLAWDRIADGSKIVLVEWGSIIRAALASEPSFAEVRIRVVDPTSRVIELLAPDAWATRPEWNRLASHADHGSGGAASTGECPVCGRQAAADPATTPFCSERCKLADLGKWFSGTYTLSRELVEEDLSDPDLGRQPPSAS